MQKLDHKSLPRQETLIASDVALDVVNQHADVELQSDVLPTNQLRQSALVIVVEWMKLLREAIISDTLATGISWSAGSDHLLFDFHPGQLCADFYRIPSAG